MSTRSTIGIVRDDEKWGRFVYCNYDGYPEMNGFLLNDFYNDVDLADKLIAQGDMSSLRENHAKTTFDHKKGHDFSRCCPRRFKIHNAPYWDTLKEVDYSWTLGSMLTWYDHMGAEYAYIYFHDRWITSPIPLYINRETIKTVNWQELSEVLKGKNRYYQVEE